MAEALEAALDAFDARGLGLVHPSLQQRAAWIGMRALVQCRLYIDPMHLVDTMIDQIGTARRTLEDGRAWLPTWQIATPEGRYQLVTEFDAKAPEQRERMLGLMSRFMAWKLATAFVMTSEVWLGPEIKYGGEPALLAVGVSRHERIGLLQRIRHLDPLTVTSPEWLRADQLDEIYSSLLPGKISEIGLEEIAELTSIFGDGGEMQAERLS